MVASASSPLAHLGWWARRPWVRRQLRSALLAAAPERRWLTVAEAAQAAGLQGVPSGEVHAALTELVGAGAAEGLRGPRGWSRVRALARVEALPFEEAVTARRRRSEVPAAAAHGAAGPRAAAGVPPTTRSFSVTTRLPWRRAGGVASGALLFGVALVIALVAAVWLIRSSGADGPSIRTRAEWYQQAARAYADAHVQGRQGFGLPYRFTEVTGVREDAPRLALEMGMMQYLQVALFSGYPSQGGILAWARSQFGELPAGPAADPWMRRAAQAYAARSLAGIPGYEITPALQAAGTIAPGERNPAALADGLVRAFRAALFLGAPEPGGVLDWARRTFGDLPRE